MKSARFVSVLVGTCRRDDLLPEAARRLWESDMGIVTVVDEDGRVVGVVTDEDVRKAVEAEMPVDLVVESLMSELSAERMPFDEFLDSSRGAHLTHRRLPVVDGDGRFVGVVAFDEPDADDERRCR